MKRILWSSLAILIIGSLLLPGCNSPAPQPTPSVPPASPNSSPAATSPTAPQALTKIRVATDATWIPFEYVNETDKEIVGFDIDLFKAIAEKQGLQLEFINVQFEALLAGMAQGQYDAAISSITIKEDRLKNMLFSDPYYVAGQIITVQKSNTAVTGASNLTGKVGAQIGTTGADEVANIKGATLKTYDDIGLAYLDLMNGQISGVVCDNYVAVEYVAKNPDKLKMVGDLMTSENYGIAVSKNKPELVTKINAGLAAVKKEGLIEKLTDRWLAKK